MTAKFLLEGLHEPVIEIRPEMGDEAILLASFIRYDANVFRVYVERYANGQIERVVLRSEAA